jgi:DSBA-like thioredoxin domain
MKVEFWVDPACPFCWMTSRWMLEVSEHRDIDISWQPISLLVKNATPPDSPFYDRVAFTRNLLRVMESVRAAGGEHEIGDMYTAFGTKIHHEGESIFDVLPVLDGLGLGQHAGAMDDASFDPIIQSAMDDGLSLVGNDVGTPIIAIEGAAGRVGLFGPVITVMPKGDAALKLWDGYLAMVDTPGFFELKRTRTTGPDMSTIDLG